MTFRLPFITPGKKPGTTPDGTQQTNVNLFKNPIPFSQTDWAPVKPFPRVAQQTVTFNNLLFITAVVAAPFVQNSFPPVVRPQVAQIGSVGLNLNLYKNPIPFAQTDWNKPFFPQSAPLLLNNTVLFNLPPAPFYTQDFSTTRAISGFAYPQYPNIALLNTSVASAPFYTRDFSKPFFPLVLVNPSQQSNLNLFTNPIPFAQLDWSKPQAVSDWQPALSWQPSLSLTTAPVASPFIPVDYNRSFRVLGLPPGSGPINLNLFKNPIPFGPFDWSKPVRLQGALYPAPQPYNQSLFKNPVPFAQFDWSKPLRAAGPLPAPLPIFVPVSVAPPPPPPPPPPVSNPLGNLKMYTGSMGAVSNREDWIVNISFIGDDGSLFDMTTASDIETFICPLDKPHSPVLSASLNNGIVLADNNTMQWHFAETDMANLCAAQYGVFNRVKVSGFWTQTLSASVAIIEGGPK